jgi:hypothetical protein
MCSRCLCNYLSLLASRGFAIQIHSCPAAKASDIKYADLDQSTPLHAPNPEKYRTTPGDFFLSYQSLVCKRDAGYEPGGREFESLRARQFLFANQGVESSNLSGGAVFSNVHAEDIRDSLYRREWSVARKGICEPGA